MIPNFKILVQTKGSSTLSPAHGKGGARATILFLSATPPEKSAGGFQQAGKKEGGLGEGIFARLLSFPFRLSKRKAEGGFGAPRSRASSLRGKNSVRANFKIHRQKSKSDFRAEMGSRRRRDPLISNAFCYAICGL